MTDRKEKRNHKALIITLLILVALLITGAFIGTMARFITSNTVSDNAVVARFGLGVPTNVDLFADSYTNVIANTDGKKIIAPGTEGSYSFEVSGTSEVAYRVSADVNVTYSEEWDGYAPLDFSLDGETWTSLANFEDALESVLASTTIAPNSEYSSNQTIFWRWPFFVSAENDILDTQMGVLSAETSAPAVTVNIVVTATQVD